MFIKRSGFTNVEDLFLSIVNDLYQGGFSLKFGPDPTTYKNLPPGAGKPSPIWTLESGPEVDPLYESQPWRVRLDATATRSYGWQVIQQGVSDLSLGSSKITPFKKYTFKRMGQVMVGTEVQLPNNGTFVKFKTSDDTKIANTPAERVQTYFKGRYDDSLANYMASLTAGTQDLGSQAIAAAALPTANDYLTPYSPNARINKDLFMDWVDANIDIYGNELDDDLYLEGSKSTKYQDAVSVANTCVVEFIGGSKYLTAGSAIGFSKGGIKSMSSGTLAEVMVANGFVEVQSAEGSLTINNIRGEFEDGEDITVKTSSITSNIVLNYGGLRCEVDTWVKGSDNKFYKCIAGHFQHPKYRPIDGAEHATMFDVASAAATAPTGALTITNYVTTAAVMREIDKGDLVKAPDLTMYVAKSAHTEDPQFAPGVGTDWTTNFELAPKYMIVGTIEKIVQPISHKALRETDWDLRWIGIVVQDKAAPENESVLYTGVSWDDVRKEIKLNAPVDEMFNGKQLIVRIVRSNLKFGYTNFNVVPGNLGYILSESEISNGRPCAYILSITNRGFALACSTEAMSFIENGDFGFDEMYKRYGNNAEVVMKNRGPYSDNVTYGYTGFTWMIAQRLCNAKTDEVLVDGHSPVVCWYAFPEYSKYIAELIQCIDPTASLAVAITAGTDPAFDASAQAFAAILNSPGQKVLLGDGNGPFEGVSATVKLAFKADQGTKTYCYNVAGYTGSEGVRNGYKVFTSEQISASPITYTTVYVGLDWSAGDAVGVATVYKVMGDWIESPDPINDPYFIYDLNGQPIAQLKEIKNKGITYKYNESHKIGYNRNIRQIVVREDDVTAPSAPVIVDKYSDYVNSSVNHRKQISISNKDEYIINIPDGVTTRRNLYHNERLDMVGFISGNVVSEGTYATVTMNAGSSCDPNASTIRKRVYIGSRSSVGNNEGSRLMILAKGGGVTPPNTTAVPGEGTFNHPVPVTLEVNGPAKIYYTTDGTEPKIIDPKAVMNDGSLTQIYTGNPITLDATTELKFFAVDVAGNEEAVVTQQYQITGA